MEWTFGITDTPPSQWKKCQPMWEDERLTATSSHTYHEVMEKLCEMALSKRRESEDDGSYGIDDHMWDLTITTLKQALVGGPSPTDRFYEMYDSSSEDEDDDEDKYRGPVLITPRRDLRHRQEDMLMGDDDGYQLLSSEDTKLTPEVLPEGSIIKCTYDFGSTTTLFLKVLTVRSAGVKRLLQYFEVEGDVKRQQLDLEAVPAYQLPKEKQLDRFYPNMSKAFLGYHVPLLCRRKEQQVATANENNENVGGGRPQQPRRRGAIGCATLGLSARIRGDDDTEFCSMEDSTKASDLLHCPLPFNDDINEFWAIAEQSWTPRDPDQDPDQLHTYSYNGVCRCLVPSGPVGDHCYQQLATPSEEQNIWGSKKLVYRLPANTKKSQNDNDDEFDFAQAFPNTNVMLKCGKFRWFQYKNGVLRVIVGRGIGQFHRDYGSRHILRTWKHTFNSLHELLCAVEASWIWKGKELKADTFLSEFDTDLGPSNPAPKEAPIFGKEGDAVVVTKCNDKKKLVTALAIAEENGGETVLYSGHDDGTLKKWSLDDNQELWSKQIYTYDNTQSDRDVSVGLCMQDTCGVAGLVVRQDPKNVDQHLIYTWSDAYEGYPDCDFDDRGPAKVKVWTGKEGKYKRSYSCDVGDDQDGNNAHPSITCVVFCRLYMDDQYDWVDTMVVGLHCICPRGIQWNDDYSNFDLERAAKMGEGNILPFFEYSNGTAMPTWREHRGIIQALAVIPDKYLFSYSMRPGHGFPDAMVLWSLKEPGVPLRRSDFWDPSRSLFKQEQTRLSGVSGISVSGTDILLACEYGDRVAVVTVEDEDGDPCLELHGYANIGSRYYEDEGYHGRMAMFGTYAVMSNELAGASWLFNIEGNSGNVKLDRRDGNPRDFEHDDDDVEDPRKYAGREIAVGQVIFPLWGGSSPKRKKRKTMFGMTEDDTSDGLGKGGPIALAIRGKWLVAGFSNGTIARAPYLPDQFLCLQNDSATSNDRASCSSLASDEWYHPVLDDMEGSDDEESDDERRDDNQCSIQ